MSSARCAGCDRAASEVAVRDFLVLGEGVGDEGEESDVSGEGPREHLRPAPAFVLADEKVEHRFERQRLALYLETQGRHGFVEQAVPGRLSGQRLLVEQLLDAILELVRVFLAQIFDPRSGMAERRHRQNLLHLGQLGRLAGIPQRRPVCRTSQVVSGSAA